jgi:hypothetical protein
MSCCAKPTIRIIKVAEFEAGRGSACGDGRIVLYLHSILKNEWHLITLTNFPEVAGEEPGHHGAAELPHHHC